MIAGPGLVGRDGLLCASVLQVDLVVVPARTYLALDGSGDGTAAEYDEAANLLTGVSRALRGPHAPVAPVELLWSRPSDVAFLDLRDRCSWTWTAVVAQPASLAPGVLDRVVSAAQRHGSWMHSFRWREGLSVQTLHVGPRGRGWRAIARLSEWADHEGYRMRGRPHEIHLDEQHTILRHPVESLDP